MSSPTSPNVVRLSKGRSRVTNGSSAFVEADPRTRWARRFRDLCAIYAEHIGGSPTAPQLALIRRIASLDVEAERIEGRLAEGDDTVNLDLYNRLAGNQRRLLAQLGFEATKRDLGPVTIAEYAALKRQREAAG